MGDLGWWVVLIVAAWLEAASIPAFIYLARELDLHGAPSGLARAALAAARDEIRHARVMYRLLEGLGVDVDEYFAGHNFSLRVEEADIGTERNHFSGNFQSRNIGRTRWRRIVALALRDVRTIYARRLDLDQDFSSSWCRHRAFLGNKHLRPARRCDADCSHA